MCPMWQRWHHGSSGEMAVLEMPATRWLIFLQFHPDHLGAGGTLTATNLNLVSAGVREMSEQEYFVYVGIMFALSFYPKIPTHDLFSSTSTLRRSDFLVLPDLSVYMAYSRFKDITTHLTFITVEEHQIAGDNDVFWKVQPLVDAFNHCRRENFSPGAKVVVDESIFEWKGKDQRFGNDGCPHVTKIIRKPKGVGMEAKNLACCTTGIMVAMELMGPKEEM